MSINLDDRLKDAINKDFLMLPMLECFFLAPSGELPSRRYRAVLRNRILNQAGIPKRLRAYTIGVHLDKPWRDLINKLKVEYGLKSRTETIKMLMEWGLDSAGVEAP